MLIEAVLLGTITGWLRRGKIRRLTGLTLPGWPLAVLALAIQLVIIIGFNYGWAFIFPAAPYLHVISYAPLLGFVYLNRNHRGMILIGLGLLLNLIVIAANKGFMPVNPSLLTPLLQEELLSGAGSPLHMALTDEAVFPLLCDQIRIPYRLDKIISIGDILLAVGIGILIQHNMVLSPGSNKTAAKDQLPSS